MVSPNISEDDQQAYVDGALTPERRRAVEAHLASDLAAARRVAAFREQNDLLHTLYDPVLDEPIPQRLQPDLTVRRNHWIGQAVAAGLLLLIGGYAGWWLRGLDPVAVRAPEQDLTRDAVAAYAVFTPEVRHPVEVGAAEERHLVAWLSKRLKAPLKAPKLTASGFNLVGGRLLSDRSGPAGLFMYEDAGGQRLTLYVRRHEDLVDDTAFRYDQKDGIGVFYWIDSQMSYALAGRMGKNSLLVLSRTVYDQLGK